MGTLVCFHAHPDDEAISTGGVIARAHDEGHRVVLVVATDGDHGEVPDDLGTDETLVDRRRAETARSAEMLGVDRVVWLGYADSGMTGWEQNEEARSFHRADLDEAAHRVAEVLAAEHADAFTIYDWHGTYGHPDHVKVHVVGVRAAQLVHGRLPGLRVFEATMNRDELFRLTSAALEAGEIAADDVFDPNAPADDGTPFGTPEAELTTVVDVTPWLGRKRESLRCHASQIGDASFFLSMPDEAFAAAFGREWFIERGVTADVAPGWLLDHVGSAS